MVTGREVDESVIGEHHESKAQKLHHGQDWKHTEVLPE
jgi:hypothetical protein